MITYIRGLPKARFMSGSGVDAAAAKGLRNRMSGEINGNSVVIDEARGLCIGIGASHL
jgi:hypothetical protein